MFRRGFGRPFRRFPADIPPALQRANELLAQGDFPAAAVAFERLARAAEGRGGPRAAWLYLQAGRARLLNSQPDQGVTLIQQGLEVFARRGEPALLWRAGRGIVDELQKRGLADEAGGIEKYLRTKLPDGFSPAPGSTEKPPPLPSNCPGCGAPLHPDEVSWTDPSTAECPYCGSVVRTGNHSPEN
jgi:hypothetical protein